MKARNLLGFAPALLFAACSPESPTPPPQARIIPTAPDKLAPTIEQAAAKPTAPLSPPRYANQRKNEIRFQGVRFDDRTHRLRVVDQPAGPGSRFADAAAAGRNTRALAAVNGGFFTPQGKPLGLIVSEGTSTGAWNSASSLGSAVWSDDGQGRSAIRRRSPMTRSQAKSMRNLLQAGPLLIENGKAVKGLSNRKTSARTMLLWDGGNRWWVGISSATTLATLANTLATHPPTSWKPRFALNLDGGRSSEIWVSATLAGNTVHHRPIWNRPVRNFLVLTER